MRPFFWRVFYVLPFVALVVLVVSLIIDVEEL